MGKADVNVNIWLSEKKRFANLLAVFIFPYSFRSFNFYLCKRLHLFAAYKLNFQTFSTDFKLKKVHRTFLSYAWQQKAVSVSLLYWADFYETAFQLRTL